MNAAELFWAGFWVTSGVAAAAAVISVAALLAAAVAAALMGRRGKSLDDLSEARDE